MAVFIKPTSGTKTSRRAFSPIAEINVTPMVDVMLVLLVIFIVTAPLLTHAVKLDLPQASSQVNQAPPTKIDFSIDAAGVLYWDGEVVTREEASRRFGLEGQKKPHPEIHLRADEGVSYRFVAQTLADASRAGLSKVGFVSNPDAK